MAKPQALIVYGDGLQALYYEEKNPIINRKGIRVRPILVAPSDEIKGRYNLTDDDLPIVTDGNKHCRWMEYPIKQVDWLCKSKTGALLFIWCAFDGGKTDIMDKLDGLLEWDEERDKKEYRLRAQVSSLQRELEDVTSNLPEYFRKYREITENFVSEEEEPSSSPR